MNKKTAHKLFSVLILMFYLESASAVEFEKLGTAISKALSAGRKPAAAMKAFKTTVTVNGKEVTAFYNKDGQGKATAYAIVQKGIYEPNCTHTWVVGVDAKTAKVQALRVVEMSCPHAFSTNKASFLDQYKGKGPADLASLKDGVHTVAKATGTCQLTTDAVVTSIKAAQALKGKI